MATHVPGLPFALDPLIAEAKRRARRRRYLAGLGLVAAVAIATGLTLGLRPGEPGRGSGAISSGGQVPQDRLIVPGVSIAGIRFGTPRRDVAKRLGTGTPIHRDLVSYWNGRLYVVYSFHDGYTGRVQALVTRWPGFRTRSGLHVGSSGQGLRSLGFGCANGSCGRGNSQTPDAQGTILTMHHGKVAEIFVGSD